MAQNQARTPASVESIMKALDGNIDALAVGMLKEMARAVDLQPEGTKKDLIARLQAWFQARVAEPRQGEIGHDVRRDRDERAADSRAPEGNVPPGPVDTGAGVGSAGIAVPGATRGGGGQMAGQKRPQSAISVATEGDYGERDDAYLAGMPSRESGPPSDVHRVLQDVLEQGQQGVDAKIAAALTRHTTMYPDVLLTEHRAVYYHHFRDISMNVERLSQADSQTRGAIVKRLQEQVAHASAKLLLEEEGGLKAAQQLDSSLSGTFMEPVQKAYGEARKRYVKVPYQRVLFGAPAAAAPATFRGGQLPERKCYSCGGSGHLASACPNGGGRGRGAGGEGSARAPS